MTGRNEGLRPSGRQEGLQSHTTYDPAREAQTGGLRPEQIKSAEKKLKKLDGATLQGQSEQFEQWLNSNQAQIGSEKYQQHKKTLELVKQEQNRRATADELLAQVEAQGRQKPGVRDQGSGYGSGGGIFDESSYRHP